MKREHEPTELEPTQGGQKKFRAEDITGANSSQTMTRLLLTRLEFSKIIGKGGSTITNIRNLSGANLRGDTVEGDLRLVLLTGSYIGVMKAFEMISEILNNNMSVDAGLIVVNLLIQHEVAGRMVGKKGAMVQSIQNAAGCTHIRIEKDPRELYGVELRKVAIEGSLTAVRVAHMKIHELYASGDNSYTPSTMGYNSMVSPMGGMNSHSYGGGHSMGMDGYGGMGGSMISSMSMGMKAGGEPDWSIPFPSLAKWNLPSQTVHQLGEMKNYLKKTYGLQLMIAKEGTDFFKAPPSMMLSQSVIDNTPKTPVTVEAAIEVRQKQTAPEKEFCFAVPKTSVGGIIGKAGSVLKELQTMFQLRIHVEREDYQGKRLVILTSEQGDNALSSDAERLAAFQRCHEKVQEIVETTIAANAEYAAQKAAAAEAAATEASSLEDVGLNAVIDNGVHEV